MFNIGDTVLCGLVVGVVVEATDCEVTCCCSDYKQRKYKVSECSMICPSQTTLETFERSILDANRQSCNSK